MLKYSLTATAFLLVGLSACLDDGPVAPQCVDLTGELTETRGDTLVINSGLRYIESAAGSGTLAESCAGGVLVDYSLSLGDGTHVESGDEPLAFRIGERGLLPAFEQGIIGMRPGGSRRLIIAPELGYGSVDRRDANGVVVIPANSTLIFDVELIAVEP